MEDPNRASVTYRTHRHGDLGTIVSRHAVIYLEDFGCDEPFFEGYVSQVAADFLINFDITKDRCWVAELNGEFIGSIALMHVPNTPGTANLRLFIVEAKARSLGVGKNMMQLCLDFAKEAGYQRVQLRTDSGLTAARVLYKRCGFQVVDNLPQKLFKFEKGSEIWEKFV